MMKQKSTQVEGYELLKHEDVIMQNTYISKLCKTKKKKDLQMRLNFSLRSSKCSLFVTRK